MFWIRARGRPAAGIPVVLHRLDPDGSRHLIVRTTTNADGRTDSPLLAGETFATGTYELAFDVSAYFGGAEGLDGAKPFLDIVPLRFSIADPEAAYHVPLLVSPWSYSTYRGS